MALIAERGIILVTGESGSGKTRFCTAYSNKLKEKGWRIGGILCPAVFENGRKVAIEALDLEHGEKRIFATHQAQNPRDVWVGEWAIRFETLAWGNEIFQAVQDVDLLIVDELGPLEFIRQEGWQAAFQALNRVGETIKQALVVVRPGLRVQAYHTFEITKEIWISKENIISTTENG